MEFAFLYLLTVNAVGFISMLVDKLKAKKNLWRIPEAALLTIALIGGSAGSLLGMYAARHKTRHMKFTVGIPLMLAVQIVLLMWILQ